MYIAKNSNVAIRELEYSDIAKLAEYADNKKVSINLRDLFPHPYTTDDAKQFIDMVKGQNPKTFFAIEYNGEYVGNISLSLGSDVYRKSAEIGYFIGEPFWNRGITTMAIDLITDYAFRTFDVVRIHAGVFEFNKSSQRVLEKCGFYKEGIFKKSVIKEGKIYDEIRYAKTI